MATLSHSPADVIQQMLIDRGLGTIPSDRSTWPIFSSGEPTTPDNVITVYDTTGRERGRTMVDGKLHVAHGFQVRVRAVDHTTGWTKADATRWTLSQDTYQETVRVSSSLYLVHAVVNIGVVLVLGKDIGNSKRSLFTVNAAAVIRQLI